MKWTVFIILLVFTATITGPVVQSLCKSDEISLFTVDEEKGGQQSGENQDIKKELDKSISSFLLAEIRFHKYDFKNHYLKADLKSPYLDYSTPPPDFVV